LICLYIAFTVENALASADRVPMLHQRQQQASCAVQALNNAAGVPLITISDARAASERLNESVGTHRHGDATGNFSVAAIQAALQTKHGCQYVLRHIKRLTERKARKWLQKQQRGRYVVLEYNATKDTYHWIAVHASAQVVIDGALKKPFKLRQLVVSKIISKVYRLEA
jgi:Josephin